MSLEEQSDPGDEGLVPGEDEGEGGSQQGEAKDDRAESSDRRLPAGRGAQLVPHLPGSFE